MRTTRLLNSPNGLRLLAITWCLIALSNVVLAQPPSHDPSRMIRNTDGRYWIFTTGQGIWCMSSSNANFTDWRAEPTPFGNSWPSWISQYVSGFGGVFWAPDVIKIGSYYYLYYSCAGNGAAAAIGVTRATNLAGPWTDQGMVVAGNNAIDPALYMDGSRLWMSWGNWQSGIDICELNTSTGKRLNSSSTHLVSGQVEGPGLHKNGSYYYLFYQRGLCCQGLSSGYYMVVARSTSITGPYTGERTFLPNRSGNEHGPGHFGYGEGKLTYHYYAVNDNGNAKLAIKTLSFSDGWPTLGGSSTPTQPVANGTYKLRNRSSGKYLDNMGRTADGADVAQWAGGSSNNQRWVLTYSGGYYKLRCVGNGKYLDSYGHTADGSTVAQWASSSSTNQQWTITPEGSYYKVINRANGKAVDTGGGTADGSAMQFWFSNTSTNQQWTLEFISSSTARMGGEEELLLPEDESAALNVFPNPALDEITITVPESYTGDKIVNLTDRMGRAVMIKTFKDTKYTMPVRDLPSGMYILKVNNSHRTLVQKVIKQ
jgi:arabinan endo-1,5-alpha-L-arabinosidase